MKKSKPSVQDQKRQRILHFFKHPKKEIVNISQQHIDDEDCRFISQYEKQNYQTINFTGNSITREGVRYLVEAKWSNLRFIKLNRNNIGDKGIKILSRSSWLSNIQQLGLSGCSISNEGVHHLSKVDLKGLKSLVITYNNLNSQAIRSFLKYKMHQIQEIFLLCYLLPQESYRTNMKGIHCIAMFSFKLISTILLEQYMPMQAYQSIFKIIHHKFTNLQRISYDF